MAAKKILLAVLLASALAGGVQAQWREEAAQALSRDGDFKALAESIESAYPGLEETERPDAAALLAYCASKNGDPEGEVRWMTEFFETGRGYDSGFIFLGFSGQAVVAGYLNGWKARYPWIREISLIKGVGDEIIIPEGVLPLVVEMGNPALFKFSEGGEVLKAGAFQTGFNVVGLNANALFAQSKRRVYTLEVKSGPLYLKKELVLDVVVSWPTPPKPAPPPAPKVSKLARRLGTPDPPPLPPPPQIREYELSMYVGSELIMTSRKTETVRPLLVGIKPSNNPEFLKPDWNIKRNDPWANPGFNSFSVMDAIGVVVGLLKDLFKKGEGEPDPPKIQTVQAMSLDFKFRDADANPLEMRVDLQLESRSRPTVRSDR